MVRIAARSSMDANLQSVTRITVIIIGIVMLAEYSSSHVRKWVQ